MTLWNRAGTKQARYSTRGHASALVLFLCATTASAFAPAPLPSSSSNCPETVRHEFAYAECKGLKYRAYDGYWKDFTPEEKAHAEAVGYSECSWDGTCPEPKNPPPLIEDKTWGKAYAALKGYTVMSDREREHLAGIGYDTLTWDGALYSGDMSAAQLAALELLGYSECGWDDSGLCGYEMDWAELTVEEKQAAETLGYNDEKPGPRGPIASLPNRQWWGGPDSPFVPFWAALSTEEEAAAKVLGYTQLKWDTNEHQLYQRWDYIMQSVVSVDDPDEGQRTGKRVWFPWPASINNAVFCTLGYTAQTW